MMNLIGREFYRGETVELCGPSPFHNDILFDQLLFNASAMRLRVLHLDPLLPKTPLPIKGRADKPQICGGGQTFSQLKALVPHISNFDVVGIRGVTCIQRVPPCSITRVGDWDPLLRAREERDFVRWRKRFGWSDNQIWLLTKLPMTRDEGGQRVLASGGGKTCDQYPDHRYWLECLGAEEEWQVILGEWQRVLVREDFLLKPLCSCCRGMVGLSLTPGGMFTRTS